MQPAGPKTAPLPLKVLEDSVEAIEKLAKHYEDRGSLVLPLLWMIQRKQG